MRITNVRISARVRGRPGIRCSVPSYFIAISFRCQANRVSGVTMVATSASTFRPNFLALAASRVTLIVVESHTRVTDLLSENAIFLDEVLNDLLLSLVQPTRNGKDEKRKWIETGSHPQAHHERLF